jgi:beta-lactamase class A
MPFRFGLAGPRRLGERMIPTARSLRRPVTYVAAAALLLLVSCGGTASARRPSGAAARTPAPASSAPSTTTSTEDAASSPFTSLGSYIANRSGEVTATVYDADTGRTWELNPGVTQDTASVVKVEIMGAALQEAQASGQAVPESEAQSMPSMIENSNNDSATALLSDVGGPSSLATFDRAAGMTNTTPSTVVLIPGTSLPGWGLTTTTALDEVRLMSKFAYSNALLTDASRGYGLALMENVETDQRWGVSAGVPGGSAVALKDGWLPLQPSNWQVNSVGWISGQGRNYVLAVLTTGSPSEIYGIATINEISSTIFDELRGTAGPTASSG